MQINYHKQSFLFSDTGSISDKRTSSVIDTEVQYV